MYRKPSDHWLKNSIRGDLKETVLKEEQATLFLAAIPCMMLWCQDMNIISKSERDVPQTSEGSLMPFTRLTNQKMPFQARKYMQLNDRNTQISIKPVYSAIDSLYRVVPAAGAGLGGVEPILVDDVIRATKSRLADMSSRRKYEDTNRFKSSVKARATELGFVAEMRVVSEKEQECYVNIIERISNEDDTANNMFV
jgi:hypothetical protein